MKRNLFLAACVCVVLGVAASVFVSYWKFQNLSKEDRLRLVLRSLIPPNDEINYGFHVVDGEVVFEGRNHGSEFIRKRVRTHVNHADAETFRALDQVFPEYGSRVYYGVDKDNVFVCGRQGIQRLGADPATFRLLDEAGRFACDHESVYYETIKIDGADPNSFRRLKGDFSVDDNHAYLGHTTLPADASTFEATSYGRISDVWKNDEYSKGPCYTEGWNRDADHIYFGHKRFEKADPSTFEDLCFLGYAKDANNVYYEQKVIIGADPGTFEVLGRKYLNFFPISWESISGHGPFARDKNHFYWYNEIYTREGPWSDEIRDEGVKLQKENGSASIVK